MIRRILSWLFPPREDEAALRQQEAEFHDEAERRISVYREALHRHNDEAMTRSASNMIPED